MAQSFETAPVIRERGDVRIAKSARYGRRISKLSQAIPAIVRTVESQLQIEKHAEQVIATLVKRRNDMPHDASKNDVIRQQRRANITLALQRLTAPMFLVVVEGFPLAISAAVLSDYRREGIEVSVTRKPIRYRHVSRSLPLNKADITNVVVEAQAKARANDHAMGLAQNAWRYAHVEGDKLAEAMAYHWLYHGQMLKPCKDPRCKCCRSNRGLKDAHLLAAVVFDYLDGEQTTRKANNPLPRHRMKAPTMEQLVFAFRGNWRSV